jgi:hypothetical protein
MDFEPYGDIAAGVQAGAVWVIRQSSVTLPSFELA